jgi:hypothetical protein
MSEPPAVVNEDMPNVVVFVNVPIHRRSPPHPWRLRPQSHRPPRRRSPPTGMPVSSGRSPSHRRARRRRMRPAMPARAAKGKQKPKNIGRNLCSRWAELAVSTPCGGRSKPVTPGPNVVRQRALVGNPPPFFHPGPLREPEANGARTPTSASPWHLRAAPAADVGVRAPKRQVHGQVGQCILPSPSAPTGAGTFSVRCQAVGAGLMGRSSSSRT